MNGLTAILERETQTRDDRDLVAACVAGDEHAWTELVDRYKRLIFSVPLRYGLPHDEASDLFQAVCLDLVKELPRLRDPRALPKWLIQTAAHKAIKVKTRQQRHVAGDDLSLELAADTAPLPDAAIRELEQEQQLRDALETLAPRCRQMVEMLFFENPPRPYAEVAETLGLAKGSIGFIRNRCLTKLRKALEKAGL